jgi:predicted component of viral defense system (DUF524 family)
MSRILTCSAILNAMAMMKSSSGQPSLEDSEDAAEERRGIFKRGDIYKMHTYRDALPAARSVWILYPGTETRFYAATDAQDGRYIDGIGMLADPCEGVGQ